MLTFIHLREQNVKLPYPNPIYGLLLLQGISLFTHEVTFKNMIYYCVDDRLLGGKHVKDVTPVTPPYVMPTENEVVDVKLVPIC